jgi:hypothetical protein
MARRKDEGVKELVEPKGGNDFAISRPHAFRVRHAIQKPAHPPACLLQVGPIKVPVVGQNTLAS